MSATLMTLAAIAGLAASMNAAELQQRLTMDLPPIQPPGPDDTDDTDDDGPDVDPGPDDTDDSDDDSTEPPTHPDLHIGWLELKGTQRFITVGSTNELYSALQQIGTTGGRIELEPGKEYELPARWVYGGTADEPLQIITARGDDPDHTRPRAVLRPHAGKDHLVNATGSDERSHVVFDDLVLRQNRDKWHTGLAIRLVGENMRGWMVQGCSVEGFEGIGLFQADTQGGISDLVIHRNVVSVNGQTHKSQGLYATRVDGIQYTENYWLGDGYADPADRAKYATILSHNVYIQKNCTGVVSEGNFHWQASSHAEQLRTGGRCAWNLAYECPLGFNFGNEGEAEAIVGPTVANDCVVWRAIDMRPSDVPYSDDAYPYDTNYCRGRAFELVNGLIQGTRLLVLDIATTNGNSRAFQSENTKNGERGRVQQGSKLTDCKVLTAPQTLSSALRVRNKLDTIHVDEFEVSVGIEPFQIVSGASVTAEGVVQTPYVPIPTLETDAALGADWLERMRSQRRGHWHDAFTAKGIICSHIYSHT